MGFELGNGGPSVDMLANLTNAKVSAAPYVGTGVDFAEVVTSRGPASVAGFAPAAPTMQA